MAWKIKRTKTERLRNPNIYRWRRRGQRCREASIKEGGRQEGAVDRACGSQRKRGSSREEWSARSNDAGLQKHRGKVPCGFGNGQGFEDLCAVSTEGRWPKTI